MSVTNEGRCCDAVLRMLEDQHGAKRENVVRDTEQQRGIDVTCTIGGQHYALEHTLIEPFADNLRDAELLERVFNADFGAALRPVLKAHLAYTITVDLYAFRTLRGKRFTTMREALLTWALQAAARLPEPRGLRAASVRGVQPETPAGVTLSCYAHPTLGGQVRSQRYTPNDPEARRRERLLKSLQAKGPKLHAARVDNTRTVLIVENLDFSITREDLVSAAFEELAAQVEHMPDNIFLVNTFSGDTFTLTCVRSAGKACVFMGHEPGDLEYRAATLVDM